MAPLSDSSPPPPRHAALGAIALGAVLAAWLPVLPGFAPAIEGAFDLSKAQLGRVISVNGWSILAGCIAGGIWADRSDALRTARRCIVAGSALALPLPLVESPIWMLALYSGFVVAMASAQAAAMTALPRLAPRAPRRMLSLNMAITAGVLIAAPIWVGWLFARSDGAALEAVRTARWVVAVCGALALGGAGLHWAVWRQVDAAPSAEERSRAAAQRPESASRGRLAEVLVVAAVLGVLHVGTDNAAYQWLPVFLTDNFPDRAFPAAWALSGNALAYLVCRTLVAALPEDRWRRRLLIAPGFLAFGVLCASFLAPGYAASVALYVAASFLFGMEYPALLSLLAGRGPRWFGTAAAVANAVGWAGTAAWCWALGEIAERTGSTRTAMMTIPFGFLGFSVVAAVWVALARPHRSGGDGT